jgi:hypothetical protein
MTKGQKDKETNNSQQIEIHIKLMIEQHESQ